MDTPRQPRRKLKRVLKKVEKLNSSSQKLSQKKLKAAINTSLNSTNSVRTLKNNNYALAVRLETVKEELKVTKDEKNDLLEENYALREKLNSLEQVHHEEVEKNKNRVEVERMKKVFKSLNTHMSNFCVDLEQLAQICCPRSSSHSQRSSDTKENRDSEDSQQSNYEKLSSPAVDNVSVVHEISPVRPTFEEQYASSLNKMKTIERRVQMENELPRRVRRSFSCSEEDEDACVDLSELEMNSLSMAVYGGNESLGDDVGFGITDIEQPQLSLTLIEESIPEQLDVSSKKKPSSSLSRIKKDKKLSKQPVSLSTGQDLHIANEFALNLAHLSILEKNKEKNRADTAWEDVERTIHTATDMELTMPVDTTVFMASNSHENLETFRESLSSVKPRRLTRGLPETSDEQNSSQSSDELVPDAVKMKKLKLKPGQFKYSVGRKDSEGCRKEIVEVTRARSKSKKRIAELVEQLPREEPKSIFDFHEKTPKFASENIEEALSVYNLSDESASPSAPLRKDKVSRRTSHIESVSSADYSEPLNDSPMRKTSRLSRSRSRRRTKNSKRSSIIDIHLLSNDEAPEQEMNNGLTLIGGETYSEPLKDSPNNGVRKSSRVSRSRSRRRTKPLLDVSEEYPSDAGITNHNEGDDCAFVKETEHLEILQDISDKTPKMSKVSKRSRRTAKKSDKTSEDNCEDVNAELFNFEQNDINNLLEEVTCSDTLIDPANKLSENTYKNSKHTSLVDHLLVSNAETPEQEESNGLTLVGGETYSVPLKDSPNNGVRKSSRVSRSRSRRRTKPLLDVSEEYPSDAGITNHDEGDDCAFVKETEHLEILKDISDKTPKMSKISKSRSRRTAKKSDKTSEDNCEDVNAELFNYEQNDNKHSSLVDHLLVSNAEAPEQEESSGLTLVGGETYSVPLKDSPNDIPKKGTRVSRSRSRRRTKPLSDINKEFLSDVDLTNQNEGNETDHLEFLKDDSEEMPMMSKVSKRKSKRNKKSDKTSEGNCENENDLDNHSEGVVTCSEVVSDASKKSSENVPKTSRSRRQRNVDATSKLNDDEMFASETENINEVGMKMSSLLGDETTSSATDNDTRSLSRNSKSRLQTESDKLNPDHFSLHADVTEKSKEQSSGMVDDSNRNVEAHSTLQVPDSVNADEDTDIEPVRDLMEKNDESLQFSLNCETLHVNTTRGQRSNRLKKMKTMDIVDETLFSNAVTLHTDTLDDDFVDDSKSSRRKAGQTQNEKKTIKEKKSRSKRLKNQEPQYDDIDDGLNSNEKAVDILNNGDGEETLNISTNHGDEHKQLNVNDGGESDIPEGVNVFEPCTTTECVSEEESGKHVANKHTGNEASIPESRKRKRKVKDDLGTSENEYKSKSSSKLSKCKQSDDAKSAETGRQDKELAESSSSALPVTDPCVDDQSIQKNAEVSKDLKNSGTFSSIKLLKQQISSSKGAASPPSSRSALPAPTFSFTQESSGFQPERQRRNRQVVSYAEPSIIKKLRRGDPFTANLGSIQIFKSPKLQGKKKSKSNRHVLESLQNLPVTDSTIME